MLFRLCHGLAYVIQFIPLVCLHYSDYIMGSHTLFMLYCEYAFVIQIILWARLHYSDCTVSAPLLFKLHQGGRALVFQIVPQALLCYSDCTWVHLRCSGNLVVGTPLLFRLYCRHGYVIQIVLWVRLCYSDFKVSSHTFNILYHGRPFIIQIVPGWVHLHYSDCVSSLFR